MIITRKIEIYVCEQDKEMKKAYEKTIRSWRDYVRMAANMIVSHKFVQKNVRDFMYLQDDVMQRFLQEHPDRRGTKKNGDDYVKFNVNDVLKDEKGCSEQNTTYRLCSSILKGKMHADIYSCLNQAVSHSFDEAYKKDVYNGKAAIRSYKNNIPIPFSAKAIANIHGVREAVTNTDTGEIKSVTRYYFTLFGIPFCCFLGADKSHNGDILDRVINQLRYSATSGCEGQFTGYKLNSSSIAYGKTVDRVTGKKKTALFLYLCINIPKREVQLKENKVLFAYLGVMHPVQCLIGKATKDMMDKHSKMLEVDIMKDLNGDKSKWIKIGDQEEFMHRRRQIQEAVRRCQVNCRYSVGGKGRKRKLQPMDRFHEKEQNYIDSKLHMYSRKLVDIAMRNQCGIICLVNQPPREKAAKEDNQNGKPLVLRNWSYFGLKQKIAYKADIVGIELKELGKDTSEDEEEDTDK